MAYMSEKSFNPYSAGNKIYGGGRSFPTMGPVDKLGYAERDLKHRARRNMLLRKLQAKQKGRHFSADALREGT